MTTSELYTVEDGWIELWDGTPFHFGADTETMCQTVTIEAIAHSLSMLCRYNGHTKRFYSVLEHTYIMAERLLETETSVSRAWALMLAYTALHHEDAEAIIGDMARPVKEKQPDFKGLDDHISQGMSNRFGFMYPFPPTMKDADARILCDEREKVMNPSNNEWGTDKLEPLGVRFRPLMSLFPWYGKWRWLRMHRWLTKEIRSLAG